MAHVLNLAMFSDRWFYDLQKDYVSPVVHTTYVRQQEAIIEYLRDNQLHLSNDGCYDSPGYSAKYATYSLTDSATDLILDCKFGTCISETGSSVAMEKEGFRCCLDKLFDQGVDIISVATDRHTGVASLMKNVTVTLNMMCGIWPKVLQKLTKKAKAKHCDQLFPWMQSIYGGLHKVVKVMHNF